MAYDRLHLIEGNLHCHLSKQCHHVLYQAGFCKASEDFELNWLGFLLPLSHHHHWFSGIHILCDFTMYALTIDAVCVDHTYISALYFCLSAHILDPISFTDWPFVVVTSHVCYLTPVLLFLFQIACKWWPVSVEFIFTLSLWLSYCCIVLIVLPNKTNPPKTQTTCILLL